MAIVVFDDSIEIHSYGRLPSGVTVEQLSTSHRSELRNPPIAEAFHRTGAVEVWGRGADLCTAFGVSPSAGAAKGREIMRMCGIGQLDPNWCLPSRLADNPLAWFVDVHGFIVDARRLPREVQEALHRRGVIPFVPEEPA